MGLRERGEQGGGGGGDPTFAFLLGDFRDSHGEMTRG
eukprot:COSAG06_NODE_8074_length_2281_cov_1.702108_4_plen_36_part_01